MSGVTFSYQWIYSDGNTDTDIPGATATIYVLGAADIGRTIKVRVSFTDGEGYEETLTSAPTAVVPAGYLTPPSTPEMPTGKAIYQSVVDVYWKEVPRTDSYEMQFFRDQWFDLPGDGIEVAFYGAGALVRNLPPRSVYYFRVRAVNSLGPSEWSDHLFMKGTGTQDWTDVPEPTNEPATGAPTVSGTAQVGETLTASTSGIEDGNGLDRVKIWLAVGLQRRNHRRGHSGCDSRQLHAPS